MNRGEYKSSPGRGLSAVSRGDSITAIFSVFVFATALVIFVSSPGKVHLEYGTPGTEGFTGYATGFPPWGIRAALAALIAFAGLGFAILLALWFGDGWPALGLVVDAIAFVWIADYSRDYRQMWVDRAAESTIFTVTSYGPSGFVAVVASVGALASTMLAIWTILRALRRRRPAAD